MDAGAVKAQKDAVVHRRPCGVLGRTVKANLRDGKDGGVGERATRECEKGKGSNARLLLRAIGGGDWEGQPVAAGQPGSRRAGNRRSANRHSGDRKEKRGGGVPCCATWRGDA